MTLAAATNAWKHVYGYRPPVTEVAKKKSFLIVMSSGSKNRFESLDNNPRAYRFTAQSYVLAYSTIAADSWDSHDAEDELDAKELAMVQLVRNNTQTASWNVLQFDDSFSNRQDIILGSAGTPYIVETWQLIAFLAKGSM